MKKIDKYDKKIEKILRNIGKFDEKNLPMKQLTN